MDKYDKSVRANHNYRDRRDRENPSFSSTLLDAIYRSIDEGHGREAEEELVLYRETMRKKHSDCTVDENDIASLRRACMIEKWMEQKVSEKVVVRRKSVADFERTVFLNSSSSSSDSSSGGVFSSSEAESVHGVPSRSPAYTMHRPKPIRTSVSVQPEKFDKHEKDINTFGNYQQIHISQQKSKHESGFVKTKSKASKIYSDFKKVKQPISPGGRLASFLNSLFTAGNAKKAKISSAGGYDDASSERKSKSAHESTCSSASSFSRSCLSKTPSSRGKLSNGTKRSVRFYPVSVIVDEDCQPCGHKSLYEDERNLQEAKSYRNSINDDLKTHLKEKNRRVEEAARDLLKNYQKKVQSEYDLRNVHSNVVEYDVDGDEEEDDDDAGSDASSDLFELDNLSAIGIERYREELPVYETTYLDKNRAIANGLIL